MDIFLSFSPKRDIYQNEKWIKKQYYYYLSESCAFKYKYKKTCNIILVPIFAFMKISVWLKYKVTSLLVCEHDKDKISILTVKNNLD